MQLILDWLDTIGAGALVLAVVGWLIGKRRSRSDIGKLDAEAAQIIANAAAGLVAPLSDRVGKLESRVRDLESENAATKSLLDSAIVFIRTLLAWIEHRIPGVPPPPIPSELRGVVDDDVPSWPGT